MKKKLLSLVTAVALVASLFVGCGSSAGSSENASSDDGAATTTEGKPGEGKKVGFVTFGLGGDFFQMLADEFVTVFEEAGYEAQYADGEFNPTTQIEACENFIAMGVDVLFCWSVAPESMDGIVAECQEKGIKFVAFVAPTTEYDALMVSDDAELADCACKLAAKWIDETYADAEDHSVPVVVLSCRTADTGVIQADELDKIEEFSTKAKFVKEIECQDETVDDGMSAVENLYATDDSTKVILTAHSNLATGANNYLTGLSSPVQDYSDMAIFAINGDNAMAELIKSSINDECPLRGMVLTGSVHDTASEMLYVCDGLLDGSLEAGHIQKAGTMFVYADTVDEYLETGTVTSVTNEDF
ncbi:sugar ABC transporter substrate-binding protein [Pseudobutyrivibrio sp.]|uniref:sugar ABC transporter substrate-binding protein n=1 Tax=Pseudobutyrivibrio sp. TaxID=2014367 RepID=UPI001E112193|nr:substrate-binding domain-containing protein [Pseudobutyrivibrio sp.]MBE5910285.1 sugar ABC transporter substrate-binding protein [Pseudobutyrivibrio sp.]